MKYKGVVLMQFQWQQNSSSTCHLKQFLHQRGVSHRLFLKLRNQDMIKLNQHFQRTNVVLNRGDVVAITLPDETADQSVAVSNLPLQVVYEDQNWLVVNKPVGLTAVPGPSNRTDTLVNRVKGHLIVNGAVNLRPHLITRLDRFTSGLVLIAKHQLANSIAVQMNQHREIEKEYLAVVRGIMTQNHGMIDQPIGRIGDQIQREVLPGGQPSITEYWVVKRCAKWTVVRLKLHTGRTHQIRVHMAFMGHPLVGDVLYGGPVVAGLDHQALDAHRLAFYDLFSQQPRRFETTVPRIIESLIQMEVSNDGRN